MQNLATNSLFVPDIQTNKDSSFSQAKSQRFTISQNIMYENINHPNWSQYSPNHIQDSLSESLLNFQLLENSLKAKIKEKELQDFPLKNIKHKENRIEFHDSQVLRFYAYFTEPVYISRIETEMQRKVTILFYLCDQSVQVIEPKIKNSGIPHGDFLKRQKILINGIPSFQENSFKIGEKITLFSREFFIYDADDFTKEYSLNNNKNNTTVAVTCPIDQFTVHAKKTDKTFNSYNQNIIPLNTTPSSRISRHHKLEQYLKYDKMVLCFDAFWEDNSYSGVLHKYRLFYHLSDDSIEVQEIVSSSNNKLTNPTFLKRARLPKILAMVHCPGMTPPQVDFYHYRDLIIPNKVCVFGRDCTLFSCDSFTKSFYLRALNYNQVDVIVANPEINVPQDIKITPVYNGFGSEEDSLMNCNSIVPKPLKSNVSNRIKFSGIILRFVCRMVASDENASFKQFLLSFYLENNSLMIYLLTDKNSGIIHGKFLERGIYKNFKKNGATFSAVDFEIGGFVEINKYFFQILSADEFTVEYLIENKIGGINEKINTLVQKIKCQKLNELNELILNEKTQDLLDFEEFLSVLTKSSLQLTEIDCFYLFFKLKRDKKSKVSLGELTKIILETK